MNIQYYSIRIGQGFVSLVYKFAYSPSLGNMCI